MERRIQQIRKRKHFSEEFKRNLVEAFEKGRHGVVRCIGPQAVRWLNETRSLMLRSRLLIPVDALRKEHPGCGMEKMFFILKSDFLGRDRFIELMTQFGYRIKTPPNYQKTTYPGYLRHPNLIDGLIISFP